MFSCFKPVLVMDVWEHAFLLDYKPSERAKYSNVDWNVVDECLGNAAAVRPVG